MACPKCSLQLFRASIKRPRILFPTRRQRHSPAGPKLGAFTHPQEWTNTTYSFNKSHTKTLPVATNTVDNLLTSYATQTKRRIDPSNPLYQQITRSNIAAQRRVVERVLISKSTAKDFGDRVEVTAFVYDGLEAADKEKEAKMKKRMGVKPDGEAGGQGNRRGPARRRVGGGAGGAGSGGNARVASPGGGVNRSAPRGGGPAASGPRPRAPIGGGGGGSGGVIRRVSD